MLSRLREHKIFQKTIALLLGVVFGFTLHKATMTSYDTVIGLLMLSDWTLLKVLLTAIICGMIGVHILSDANMINRFYAEGSFGSTVPGGLLLGLGLTFSGYTPATALASAATGSLDALLGVIPGILIGVKLYWELEPVYLRKISEKGYFGQISFHQLFINKANTVVFFVFYLLGLLGLIHGLS